MSKKQSKENLQEEVAQETENTETEALDSQESVEEQVEEEVSSQEKEINLEDYNKTLVALELAQKELEVQKDQYLRLRAEFENYRRRTTIESAAQKTKGIGLGVEAFFPCMDALDRAIALAQDDANLQGLMLIKKQFDQALKMLGVTEINPEYEEFDPEIHNAVMQEVDLENAGKVIQVLQKGYKINDTLLRPAMVKVATEE